MSHRSPSHSVSCNLHFTSIQIGDACVKGVVLQVEAMNATPELHLEMMDAMYPLGIWTWRELQRAPVKIWS